MTKNDFRDLEFEYDSSQSNKITHLDNKYDGEERDVLNKNRVYKGVGNEYEVRGKNYMKDKVKVISEESAFELVYLIWIEHNCKLWNVGEHIESIKTYISEFPDDFFLIINRQVPAKKTINCISISRRKRNENDSTEFSKLFETYLKSEDKFRNERLKYIARVEHAPWAVLTSIRALGGEKPVIMGNGYLKQTHYIGDNYYEVNVDISSSFIARQISGTAVRRASNFIISECFLIEGQSEEELPERVLCCWTMENINVAETTYDLQEQDLAFYTKYPTPIDR